MPTYKSQTDQMLYLITAVLRDIQAKHSDVITSESLQADVRKVVSRVSDEGASFLTKALPRLGKALDRAFSGSHAVIAAECGFKSADGSKLPLLLGPLWQRVCDCNGKVLRDPCIESIRSLRQCLYLFYKYELPYEESVETGVIDGFIATEKEITPINKALEHLALLLESDPYFDFKRRLNLPKYGPIIRHARRLLFEVFRGFDPHDIVPGHGPGAVSTGETLWDKWTFTRISPRIAESYPIDEFFFSSLSHVCDRPDQLQAVQIGESSAKIVLVPKDSRGPRVISEEPLDFQFVQQGLRRALYSWIENSPYTRWSVHFTDQGPNQFAAIEGSRTGNYATLDLKDASDRVTVGLVKLLFPEPLLGYLLNCRSLSTKLPDGSVLELSKYAPMGSALCFPVLALSCWALIQSTVFGAHAFGRNCTREGVEAAFDNGVLVYGDDVIVPTAHAENAIEVLEAFGLKVNRDKSFISGLFRESCGKDAVKGEVVTPVRFKTVWSSSRSPEVLASWTAYANSFYKRSYFYTYELIAGWLFEIYKTIPERRLDCPSLMEVPEKYRPRRKPCLRHQKMTEQCWTIRPRKLYRAMEGWKMLFRFLLDTHGRKTTVHVGDEVYQSTEVADLARQHGGRRALFGDNWLTNASSPYLVRSYTKARDTKLVRRWL